MSKFAVGQLVDSAAQDHESGTVVAVFPTVDDSFRYAVDMEGYGLLPFFSEEKTSRSRREAGTRSTKVNGGCREGSAAINAVHGGKTRTGQRP